MRDQDLRKTDSSHTTGITTEPSEQASQISCRNQSREEENTFLDDVGNLNSPTDSHTWKNELRRRLATSMHLKSTKQWRRVFMMSIH